MSSPIYWWHLELSLYSRTVISNHNLYLMVSAHISRLMVLIAPAKYQKKTMMEHLIKSRCASIAIEDKGVVPFKGWKEAVITDTSHQKLYEYYTGSARSKPQFNTYCKKKAYSAFRAMNERQTLQGMLYSKSTYFLQLLWFANLSPW